MTKKPTILVETVVDLSKEQTAKLEQIFQKRFGSSRFQHKEVSSLIGGLRVTVGSTRVDSSILGALERLTQTT